VLEGLGTALVATAYRARTRTDSTQGGPVQPIVYIDTSTIREGKLRELEAAMTKLAAFAEANVPQLISYGFYLDEDRRRMSVASVHPDSASLERHMDVGGAEFRKFAELIELRSIEVYGAVSDGVLERLHKKAQMLGDATVAVYELYAGFAR
jgi:hypothetical protein